METIRHPEYLETILKLFRYYRNLGEKAVLQIADNQIHAQPYSISNSVAIIVKHMAGNMRSRFTDFLTSDGEKPWRNRDAEFENGYADKNELLSAWNDGWNCFFAAVEPLTEDDLQRTVFIRNEGHTVLEAITRQLAHYSYHVGQLVYVCRMLAGDDWQSLSIPKGGSAEFNAEKFSVEKSKTFFTDKL